MSFLRDVDDYKATQSTSLVFEMAPGYRELYKYYLMIQRGLSVHGDVFRMSLKDTDQLYEYWCFIKLVTLLKHNYQLLSSDIIKVDNTGVTISLVKGKKSEVKFYSPRGGMIINEQHSVIVADGFFTIANASGDILDRIAINDFSNSPRVGFKRIMNTIIVDSGN